MSIWDKIEDLFKTKEEIADEEAQRAGAAVEGETTSGLVDALKNLEDELNKKNTVEEPDYDKLFPEVKLEKKEYTPATDEEIEKRAQDETAGDYQKKTQNLLDSVKKKGEELSDYNKQLSEKKIASLAGAESAVERAKETASDDMLKRGLGRSSIVAGILGEYDKAGLEKAAEILNSYDSKIADVEKEISGLESEKKKSLDELDLAHAKEVSDRIAELKEERLKLSNEAIAENNKIAQKQADLDADRLKDIEKYKEDRKKKAEDEAKQLAEYEKKYGYSGEKQQNYAKRYELALRYYLTVDSDIALKALESSANMKYYLGNYYDKLKSVLTDRANNTDRYGIT